MIPTPKKPRDSSPKLRGWPRPTASVAAVAAIALAAGLTTPTAAAQATGGSRELLRQLRTPTLAIGSAVEVRDVELALGPGRFAIERGLVLSAGLDSGRPVEVVFVGQARFRFEPPNPVEVGQLELFTGERSLDVAVGEAVLALADVAQLQGLLAHPTGVPPVPASVEHASALHGWWLGATERRKTGVVSGLLRALEGDTAYRGYFAAWCSSPEVGNFLFRNEPEDLEPIMLASYEPPELSFRQSRELDRYLRGQNRKRRSLGVELADLGTWDVWNSMAWPAAGAGSRGFEPKHYTIDASIRRDRMMLEGRSRLELEVQAAGRRSVRLDLMRDMEVQWVTGAAGDELFWFRDGEQIVVLLPAAATPGETLVLDLGFRGRALHWVTGRSHVLSDTLTWYPHAGTLDRATYDVTLRWPKDYDVIAAGRLVAEGRDGRERWQRRRVDRPSIGYSFVLGDYEIEHGSSGEVELTVAFDRRDHLSVEQRAQVLRSVGGALDFFETTFGPYPQDELIVATVPRAYSQSHLGFVTLSSSLVQRGARSWVRDATIAHEVAHQWWGNLIGWESYRDQWLSEGMANYAALLLDLDRHGEESNMLAVMSGGWRESLMQRTHEGRPVESLGPVILGSRLNSSLAPDAYRPIVYRKGATVLAMLARAIGEERFLNLLREIAGSWVNRALTTEDFLDAVERVSGLDLEDFARQYVYGTGIPQVYYSYDATPDASGTWTLRGEARRLSQPGQRYRIARDPLGRLDVESEVLTETAGAEEPALLVPFEVWLERSDTSAGALAGRLSLSGREEAFEIRTEHRPRELRFDPRGEILANFYSKRSEPKLYLRHLAEDLALGGQEAEAEARYLEALGTESPLAGLGAFEAAMWERRDRTEDLRIRLALVRMWIDQDRDGEAQDLLDRLERELPVDRRDQLAVERSVLRSRLEVRSGDHASARRRLKGILRLVEPRPGGDWRDLMGQPRLNAERGAITEAYALLAIATHETARVTEYARAVAAARARGVDVSALDSHPL